MIPVMFGFTLVPVAVFDLAEDDHAFEPSADNLNWEWGVPTTGPGGSEGAWATQLDRSYLNDSEDALVLPMPSLANVGDPVLILRHWYSVQTGDSARIEVDDGSGWQTVTPIYGYPHADGFVGSSLGWTWHSIDLDGLGTAPQVRLVFEADTIGTDAGWYIAEVAIYDGDATPPLVEPVTVPEDTEDVAGPYVIAVDVTDDAVITDVAFYVDTGRGYARIEAEEVSDGRYQGEIDGQPSGTEVSWFALAHDEEQSGRWPAGEASSFLVELPAPTDLEVRDERLVGDTVLLGWTAPESDWAITGYVLDDSVSGAVVACTELEAEVPVDADGIGIWTVSAVFEVGEGPPSEPLEVRVEVPVLTGLEPDEAYAGDGVWVELAADGLYLSEDTLGLDLGDGVTVEELELRDVSRLRALVRLDEDASAGLRDIVVDGAWGQSTFPEAFEVLDGTARPRVTAVSPPLMEQGSTETIEVQASVPFAGEVTVEAPSGLFVKSEVTVEGNVARFELVAASSAATGDRLLVLDDGARLWEARITVQDRIVSHSACGVVAGGGAWWLGLSALFWWRRRR